MIIQWLLIGGPAHGRILHIKGGSQVRYPHSDGEDYLYVAENFQHRGNVHRLGICHSEASLSDADKAALIEKTAHPPMVEMVPRAESVAETCAAPTPYRCIKPQCPLDCSGCNHAVPGDDEALVLIADMLNELAVDGFGAPCEDGDSKLVDRARAFLRKGDRGVRASDPAQALTEPDHRRWSAILKDMAEATEAVVRAFATPGTDPYNKALLAFDDRLAAHLDRVTGSTATSGVKEDGNG